MFAWAPFDFPRIDTRVVCYHLNINLVVKEVSQRKLIVGEEKRTTIDEYVQKLISSDFIMEVKYPYLLENLVLVRNSSNKWHMCI